MNDDFGNEFLYHDANYFKQAKSCFIMVQLCGYNLDNSSAYICYISAGIYTLLLFHHVH